jgi:hypothetical protein
MRAVDDRAFAPGTPEVQLDEVPNQPIWSEGKRAKIGSVVLTNDRILFIKDAAGAPPSGLVAQVLSAPLEMLAQASERAQVVVTLPELAGARVVPRRLVADLYDFTLGDGATCRFGKHLRERWDPTIQRLMTERHNRPVVDEGTSGWRVA